MNFGQPREDNDENINKESFIREGDIYINKLIDDCFYINEGIRYFLIYQIVDNSTYGVQNAVSLKSLLMPITVKKNDFIATPEYFETPINLSSYNVLLFSKLVSPVLYLLGKDSYNSLVKLKIKNPDNTFTEWQNHRDPSLITKINKFFNINLQFTDDLSKVDKEGKLIFKIRQEKEKNSDGCYLIVNKNAMENDKMTQAIVGCFLDLKNETKKKRIVFSYDQLISPWFWIDTLSNFFTKNNDYLKKFNKIRTMLISLDRLMDNSSREILNLKSEDKENTLTIIRYIVKNFETLVSADSQDLDNKRLRLYEYQLYPLRTYLSNQTYRVLNSPTRSKAVLDRIFSNLSPLYVIKQTVVNELLRYYNSTNDMNLYSAFLRYTFRGPQSLNKTVTMEQRDLHPSYTGRLSLIASAASDSIIKFKIIK